MFSESAFELFFITYFLYFVFLGFYLSLYYLLIKKKLDKPKELMLILLLPIIGLGNWQYSQALRTHSKSSYPKKWFIWKSVYQVNKIYLIMAIFVFIPLLVITYTFNEEVTAFISKMIHSKEKSPLIVYLYTHLFFFLLSPFSYISTIFIISIPLFFFPLYMLRIIENKILKQKIERNSEQHASN